MPGYSSAHTIVFLLFLVVSSVPVAAQPASRRSESNRAEPVVPEKVGKELQAYYVGESAPRIDGRLDDEGWQLAQAIDDMVQNDPNNMQPPTERTVVKVLYDDRHVYVGVINYMTDTSKITTALGRRDTFPRSDSIKITFDPRHDHLTAYTFDSNPLGVQGDMTWFDDTRSSTDYDAVWEVRTQITDEGWTAEFRIPFSQLRFTIMPGEPVVWGFNVRRDITYNAETIRWVATPRGAQGFVSRMGHITFAKPPSAPRRFEVQPFTLARNQHVTATGSDRGATAGLDMRMGLGTATTLSAAVNPDFGQVEQDPAVLNLSVFETFFPEKRPFFIEDRRSLAPDYGQVSMFHSRRIGQRPNRFAIPSGETVIQRPDATTILGATKITGKANGWTYGGLTALTDREFALVETADGRRAERLIEPYTSYNVGRVQRDLGGGSTIGGHATSVMREKDVNAYTGSMDYSLRWNQNKFNWNGQWSGTRSAIGGEMKSGFGGLTNFGYSSKYLNVFSHYDYFNRTFKNSDLGFFSNRNNKTQVNGGINVGQPDPGKFLPFLRNVNVNTSYFTQYNGDWLPLDKSWFIGTDGQFNSYWNYFVGTGKFWQTYDDLDTRGGPPIVKPGGWFLDSFVGSDSRKRIRVNLQASTSRNQAGGNSRSVNLNVTIQPRPQAQMSLSTGVTRGHDIAQWIRNEDVTGDGAVDYIYGTLDRNVVNVTARSTYAFTRDMTLEVYLQPFVAVGDYTNIRRLARAKSFEFEPVTISGNPDFNSKSLRSNVVFRWEYRRGSTLYLVYNVSNSDASRPGDFSAFRDLRSGFGAAGTQVLMVKFNYWLGL
ncbi:MAG: carbohydrate binding family 9 domain-containing protein [Cyanobacteria bacterium]|nr:carbohydrate binding family 9 domain-containing protein [Cyanobacteriota bacterium]